MVGGGHIDGCSDVIGGKFGGAGVDTAVVLVAEGSCGVSDVCAGDAGNEPGQSLTLRFPFSDKNSSPAELLRTTSWVPHKDAMHVFSFAKFPSYCSEAQW